MGKGDEEETKKTSGGTAMATTKHVRPTARKSKAMVTSAAAAAAAASTSSSTSATATTDSELVEETRTRMESWMGLGTKYDKTHQAVGTLDSHQAENGGESHRPPPQQQQQQRPPVNSILNKAPKYSTSKPPVSNTATAAKMASALHTIIPSSDIDEMPDDVDELTNKAKSAPICKSIVVERDPSIPLKKKRAFRKPPSETATATTTHAIEGYVPAISSSTSSTAAMKITTQKTPITSASATAALTAAMSDATATDNTATSTNEAIPTTETDADDDDPLILNSLAELMVAAGQVLPPPGNHPHKIDKDTQMVEADISFQVMSQNQYERSKPQLQQQAEAERLEHLERFLGKPDAFGEDNDGDDDSESEDEDDSMMEFLMTTNAGVDDDDDEEEEDDGFHYTTEDDHRPERAPRSFMFLWQALTEWMTPQTVQWVMALKSAVWQERNPDKTANNDDDCDASTRSAATAVSTATPQQHSVDTDWSPLVNRSDIGASRCAGVMAMLRLYLGGCLEELHRPMEERRKAEKRLADLLRTFDYSRENPRLQVRQWKAMTCVLLDMVLLEEYDAQIGGLGGTDTTVVSSVPPCVAAVDITPDEYRYLSRTTISSFGRGTGC